MTFVEDPVYYTIKSLLVILGVLGMLVSCVRIKYPYKKCIVILVLYLIWSALVTLVSIRLFGLLTFLRTCVFTMSIPAMIILYFISDHSPWQAVFHYTMQLSLAATLSGMQTMSVTYLNGTQLTDFIIRVSSYSLCIAIEWIFIRKRFKKLDDLPDSNWRVLAFVPMCLIFLVFFVGMYPTHFLESPTRMIYICIIFVIMLIIYGIMIYVLGNQHDFLMAQHENSLLISQLNSVKKQFDSITETEERLKMQRHDMRFYIASISEMIRNSDAQGALDYIGGVDKQLEKSQYTVYCSNKMINAVLSYYMDKARENRIEAEMRFSPPPDCWVIDTVDFTAMLSNALDNAINACKKIDRIDKRKLYIKTTIQNQYIIEIANTFDGIVEFDSNGLPKTSEKGHGIGTLSIASFAQRNNALLDYSIDGEWFKFRILSM